MADLFSDFKINNYCLYYIAGMFLFVELYFYINIYANLRMYYPDMSNFYNNRFFTYASKSISTIFALLPLITFTKKIKSRALHVSKISEIAFIEGLIRELEAIYGDIANEIFRDMCKKYKISCERIGKLKQKRAFVNDLVKAFSNAFSEDMVNQIIDKNPKLRKFLNQGS